ncbi:uncharacterized protein LOC132733020 [Ruditapes philippinarum]|uniref:uncharacterized protein LOC132733020 n=1 Tax=Ruditapes philippinarum TaxID=129788 RepID=UPI00295AC9B1|nr:uncharacterized protein LOC132733020 [Ruditapes philippinarum]
MFLLSPTKMDLKLFIICVFVSFLNTVSRQHQFMYKPTEFPYSRCTSNYLGQVTCENLNISKERRDQQSMWPPGPYAIPMSKYGCPESQSRGWFKSFLKLNMVVPSNSSDSSSTLYDRESERKSLFEDDDFFKPPFKTEDLKLYFCVKYRNETKLDQGQWIPGNYSIYKIGQTCPLEFEESSRTLPVRDFESYGIVPNIEVPNKEVLLKRSCYREKKGIIAECFKGTPLRKDGKERDKTVITKLPEMFYSSKLLHHMRIDDKLIGSQS